MAIVTGGASGLGAATVCHLVEKGAKVAILDSDISRVTSIAAESGGFSVETDVSDESSVEDALTAAMNHFGQGPRMVVNCAGIAPAARVVDREGKLASRLFERTIRVNLLGTYLVTSHAARAMMALEPLETAERGVIVNTASIAYQDGQLGQAAYAASKGAVAAMALPIAREFARTGIRVMNIAPGLFHTPMMEGLPEDVTAKITDNIPFPARLGDPKEYALLAAQIIENPYLNGTTIRLDAAVRLPPR